MRSCALTNLTNHTCARSRRSRNLPQVKAVGLMPQAKAVRVMPQVKAVGVILPQAKAVGPQVKTVGVMPQAKAGERLERGAGARDRDR